MLPLWPSLWSEVLSKAQGTSCRGTLANVFCLGWNILLTTVFDWQCWWNYHTFWHELGLSVLLLPVRKFAPSSAEELDEWDKSWGMPWLCSLYPMLTFRKAPLSSPSIPKFFNSNGNCSCCRALWRSYHLWWQLLLSWTTLPPSRWCFQLSLEPQSCFPFGPSLLPQLPRRKHSFFSTTLQLSRSIQACSQFLFCSLLGAYYFFTDDATQYPEGPQFSKMFYTTAIGVVTALFNLVGITLYNMYMKSWKYSTIFIMCNLLRYVWMRLCFTLAHC